LKGIELHDLNVFSGPCLLFERKAGTNNAEAERFYACAVYRSRRVCPYRVNVTGENISGHHVSEDAVTGSALKSSFCYAKIRRKVNSWKNKAKYYCSKCNDIFLLPHVHPLKGPVSIAELRRPTQLLAPLTQKHSESQYWFSDESLRVLLVGIRNSRCNGVLCIGTPTVFEYLQSNRELRANCKSFLLDIDSRFVSFFLLAHFIILATSTFVCYVNHVKYKRPDKSVVRFFTDLPLDVFDLSEFSNYRFCDKCEKYVTKTNLHCDFCESCPLEDGYMHKHCDICCRCVKESYEHCGACKRCHLPQRCPRFLGVEARN
uniref:CTCHY-type domain-containing protein n=1 Tax=Gongylonema pulchrum TaxID=637853 RepID=A0A183DXD7_9BILA